MSKISASVSAAKKESARWLDAEEFVRWIDNHRPDQLMVRLGFAVFTADDWVQSFASEKRGDTALRAFERWKKGWGFPSGFLARWNSLAPVDEDSLTSALARRGTAVENYYLIPDPLARVALHTRAAIARRDELMQAAQSTRGRLDSPPAPRKGLDRDQSLASVAGAFGVDKSTVRSWVNSGVPHDKVKKKGAKKVSRLLFNLDEVRLWTQQEIAQGKLIRVSPRFSDRVPQEEAAPVLLDVKSKLRLSNDGMAEMLEVSLNTFRNWITGKASTVPRAALDRAQSMLEFREPRQRFGASGEEVADAFARSAGIPEEAAKILGVTRPTAARWADHYGVKYAKPADPLVVRFSKKEALEAIKEGGSFRQAGRLLGISAPGMKSLLEQYGLEGDYERIPASVRRAVPKDRLEDALKRTGGDLEKAAEILGMETNSVRRAAGKLGLGHLIPVKRRTVRMSKRKLAAALAGAKRRGISLSALADELKIVRSTMTRLLREHGLKPGLRSYPAATVKPSRKEKREVEAAFAEAVEAGGNISTVARSLGMSRGSLDRRIHMYGLERFALAVRGSPDKLSKQQTISILTEAVEEGMSLRGAAVSHGLGGAKRLQTAISRYGLEELAATIKKRPALTREQTESALTEAASRGGSLNTAAEISGVTRATVEKYGTAYNLEHLMDALRKRRTKKNPPRRFDVRSPAQGLRAIRHPVITKNYKKALRVKPRHRKAVLVPCAGTKPFPDAPSHKSGYLKGLEGKDLDMYVVSEPLGIVPYEWSRKYPQESYDFPPHHLRGEGRELLVNRIADWFERGPRYEKILLALPGHHRRLVGDALAQFDTPPAKIKDIGLGECLASGACPPGFVRPTTKAYRKFLKTRANPVDRHYVEGGCYHLALALHEQAGWPLVAFVNDETGFIDHAGAVAPGDVFVDGGGPGGSVGDAEARLGLRARPISPSELAARTVIRPADANDRNAARKIMSSISANPPADDLGDCYDASLNFLMDMDIQTGNTSGFRLVHATVTGQGPISGKRYGHAWVEEFVALELPAGAILPPWIDPAEYGTVWAIDRSRGRNIRMPAAVYRFMGKVADVKSYTYPQARKKASKYRHYGPWPGAVIKPNPPPYASGMALFGSDRMPVDVIRPAWSGDKGYWDVVFLDSREEGTVSEIDLYTTTGERWRVPGARTGRQAWTNNPFGLTYGQIAGKVVGWTATGAVADVLTSRINKWITRPVTRAAEGAIIKGAKVVVENPPMKACDPSKRPLKMKGLKGRFVRTHVNLHNGCFVVSYKSKVQGYTKSLKLRDVRPRVGQAGWKRCSTSQVRNVHAFLDGELVSGKATKKTGKGWRQISYHCKSHGPFFFFLDTDEPFLGAKEAICRKVLVNGVEKAEVFVRGPEPARKNPSCACGAPRGVCSCGEVDAWLEGDPEKITPCGSPPRQVGVHVVDRPWGRALLLLDAANLKAYTPADWHEKGRCPLLAAFAILDGEGAGIRVARDSMHDELAHHEHGDRNHRCPELAHLAHRCGISLEQAEDQLCQEGVAWHSAEHHHEHGSVAHNP